MLWKSRNANPLDDQLESGVPLPDLAPEDEPVGLALGTQDPDDTETEAEAEAEEEASADEESKSPEEDERELEIQTLKAEIHRQVIGEIDLSKIGTMHEGELRMEIRRTAERLLQDHEGLLLNEQERERLTDDIIDETFGLGPLEGLLRDESISDILINGPRTVYVERRGRLSLTPVKFANEEHLLRIIQRIVSAIGRRVDETNPMVDARLEDGSRVNAIIPPVALDGSLVSIRRFGAQPLRAEDLLNFRAMTKDMLRFLAACVTGRLNVLVSGGTGSGKTTLLNVLSGYIPHDERVATVEDAAELQLQQPHLCRMETRPPSIEGTGEVSMRDLVKNALRMRPDRIIIGECRGAEALDMLQAMNTGHEGSLTTVHANTPRDAIARLEMMVGMAGFELPIWTIRRQIASAIHVVIQAARLTGGARKIVKISEITGMEGDVLTMHDLFAFHMTGLDENRNAQGYYAATGIRPHCLDRLSNAGVSLPVEMFEERVLEE